MMALLSHQHHAMMMSTDTVDMSSVGATHGGGSCTVAFDLSCSVTSLRTGEPAGVRGASPPDRMEANSRLQPTSCSGASLPFVVEATVGQGKYSTVYRARRVDTGELIAVKKVQVFDMNSSTRSECITEVKLLQALDHPNIIKYMDSFIMDNELVIELELAEGGDLGALIEQRKKSCQPFTEEQIWQAFVQVLAATLHMHERRMMHRDIKPSNVFVTRSGTLKLGDFGLSRHFSSKTNNACSSVGTPYYMSPEVIRGLPYDWSSDVWSLGCMLYELATLHNPFYKDGLNFYTLGKNISNCVYDPVPAHLSMELKGLIKAMIQQDASLRPSLMDVYNVATQCLSGCAPHDSR